MTAGKGNLFIRSVLLGILSISSVSLVGCSATQSEQASSTEVFSTLYQVGKLDRGSVYFLLTINGVQKLDRYYVLGDQTEVIVGPNEISTGSSQVEVSFLLEVPDGDDIELAKSVESVTATNNNDDLQLSGILYSYTDSDDDSIINAHELMHVEDIDQDQIKNYLDTDSDGDGIADGGDLTPYGDTTINGSSTAIVAEIEYETEAGLASQINVGLIQGSSGTIQELQEDSSVKQLFPSGWPMSNAPHNMIENVAWSAIEITARTGGSCPEWRISSDASSIRTNLSQPIYAVFRRADQLHFLVPLEVGEIADLAQYKLGNEPDGSDTLDNRLVALMVPPNTSGWLTLYSSREFTGAACQLNGTFPQII